MFAWKKIESRFLEGINGDIKKRGSNVELALDKDSEMVNKLARKARHSRWRSD
jgi:hypothetical protein